MAIESKTAGKIKTRITKGFGSKGQRRSMLLTAKSRAGSRTL